MLFLAILATLASIAWTVLVLLANGMSDAPGGAFKGGWSIAAAWVAAVILWIAWIFA